MTKNHKKIVVSVIVTLIVGGTLFYACQKEELFNYQDNEIVSNVQKNNEENVTAEEIETVRLALADWLIEFTELCRPYYDQSENYDEFCISVGADQDRMMLLGEKVLHLVYQNLNQNYSHDYIRSYSDGKVMGELALYFENHPETLGNEIFGGDDSQSENKPIYAPRPGWEKFKKGLVKVLKWVEKIARILIDILEKDLSENIAPRYYQNDIFISEQLSPQIFYYYQIA
jgi:hypothetical protein